MLHARSRRLLTPIALFVCALMFVACGVRYSDPEPGTEFYESIAVSGGMTAGAELTVSVGITQTNSVEVESVCELRQNKKTLFEIGRDLVPPLEAGNPDATPTQSTLRHDFTVADPGRYFVECLTPKDEDNFIAKEITIS